MTILFNVSPLVFVCTILSAVASFADKSRFRCARAGSAEDESSGKSMLQFSSTQATWKNMERERARRGGNDPSTFTDSLDCGWKGSCANVSLDDAGFQQVQSTCSASKISRFIIRYLTAVGKEVCHTPYVVGLARSFSCGKGSLRFDALIANLATGEAPNPCNWIVPVGARSSCPAKKVACMSSGGALMSASDFFDSGAGLPSFSSGYHPTPGLWRTCGQEGETVSEGGWVRFGYGLDWVQKPLPRGATCSTSTFGFDPALGVAKSCQCSGGEAAATEQPNIIEDSMNLSWSLCAKENEECSCDSGTVRYGVTPFWVVKEDGFQSGSRMACSSATFDGMNPGEDRQKECRCLASSGPSKTMLSAEGVAKVAIVTVSRRALDLKTWLQYHLDYMEVTHVFISVEESPHFEDVWSSLSQSLQDRVTVWRASNTSVNGDQMHTDNYNSLQMRQARVMRQAVVVSRAMGIDWLMHIDDDELLYAPLHRPIGQIFMSIPDEFTQVILPNVEAVYDSPHMGNCFAETRFANMDGFSFSSYGNGKSAAHVSVEDAVPWGPHQWRSSGNTDLNTMHFGAGILGSPIWLLHYESCPFQRWQAKFGELGFVSPERFDQIPFPFYRESIKRLTNCSQLFNVNETSMCSRESLMAFWSSWKTFENTRVEKRNTIPISIPWDKIRGFGE